MLLGLLLSFLVFLPTALAANIPSIQLPVKITAEGALPRPAEEYVVRLKADDKSYPMPNGQVGGWYDLRVDGPGDAVFPPIKFESVVGVYTYTIEQLPGSNPHCRYDTRSYTVRISVTNAASGEFDISVTLQEDGMSAKPAEVEFHNVYKKDGNPPSSPGPTGPTGSKTPPGSAVPTGVVDHWIIYLTGSALLLLVSGCIIRLLLRKEDE